MSFIVEDTKILNYLLNRDGPPAARPKAEFFLAIGFSPLRVDQMRHALLAHAETAKLQSDQADIAGYGRKLVFECALPKAPNGRTYSIRTVWLETEGDYRLITAYPLGPKPGVKG